MTLTQTEVFDSYRNAKRIQDTILPAESEIKRIYPESFIIYLPKDTISGDFYWIREVNNTVLFAVADCTGHGVPGAMLTVICHRLIEKSMKEFGMVIPGHILDKTLEIRLSDFKRNGQSVNDGMDIALCSITEDRLQFSGANRPLWIVREGKLIETKPTRQGIGSIMNPDPFMTNVIPLQKGDTIYLFSDGYVDQFGGRKFKKYMSAQFKDQLISINSNTMSEQKRLLEKAFFEWKGENEQTDDICILGIRILEK
ncbi:MAG TPA: SpoIIE family protein phosphatase [Bacteroidales bacterium]|nr:SpoIIE family protein phosphatase [Bacteroidales bacterium]